MLSFVKNICVQIHNLKNIPLKTLNTIILDISRVEDKDINRLIRSQDVTLDSVKHNIIRDYLLGYPISNSIVRKFSLRWMLINLKPLPFNKTKISYATKLITNGYKNHPQRLEDNIIARYREHYTDEYSRTNIVKKYVHYIHLLQKNKYQLFYLNITNQSSNQINYWIQRNYDKLSNYHNCVIAFSHPNFQKIARVAIFMENFKQEKYFNPFNKYNKESRIKILKKFLNNNLHINSSNCCSIIKKFYKDVSYGFRFIDLFIADDMSVATLVMQKIQLDETSIRCPVCFHKSHKGNSYSHVLFKSFECDNPSCPATSKSGRGKRFTLLNAKQQIMVERNNPADYINDELYKAFHLDIVNNNWLTLDNGLESAIRLYTWAGDSVLSVDLMHFKSNYYNRKIIAMAHKFITPKNNIFSRLPIVRLLNYISNRITLQNKNNTNQLKFDKLGGQILLNADSNNLFSILKHKPISIGSAITSPPYYNARQYSQWANFLCYLIDMMINAKNVYDVLNNHGIYIYNVGDIVGQDKVFIKSRMSISRLMLGFYSMLIFNIIGFNIESDIIWDKGQVQSHRNSNANHFPMYLKPDNCYEHNIIFCKGKYNKNLKLIKNKIVKIPPVKKINSKGKNTVGHSAPFPIKLAQLILPFSNKRNYILDSFVGSGTTNVMARQNGYEALGVESNKKYYQLSLKRIKGS